MSSPVQAPVATSRMESDFAFWTGKPFATPDYESDARALSIERLHSRFPPYPMMSSPKSLRRVDLSETGRYLLLVTGMNSLSQHLYTWLVDGGVQPVNLTVMFYAPGKGQSAAKEADLLLDIDRFKPSVILCPFLVTKVPQCVTDKVRLMLC